jgi:hypothetical protein
VAGGNGPTVFGEQLIKEGSPVEETSNQWGFVEDSILCEALSHLQY